MNKQAKYYKIYGFNILSEIALDELQSIKKTDKIDLSIKIKNTPENLSNIKYKGVRFQANEKEFLLNVDNVAKYYINDKNINIEPLNNFDLEEIKLFLLGSAMGVFLYRKKLIPFHGSSLYMNNKAVVLSGVSGAGKSTITLNLLQKNYKLIADDVSVLKLIDNKINVLPGINRIKLWADTLNHFNIDTEKLKRIRPNIEKYIYISENIHTDNTEISYIFVLKGKNIKNVNVKEIKAVEKFNIINQNIYRKVFTKAIDVKVELFKIASSLAQQSKVYVIEHPQEKKFINEISDKIIEIVS